MTVAETASNLNQVLLRAHVLKNADRDTALAVLDEAFYFAHRYLFMMPTLSRVEHLLHGRFARGKTMSASQLRAATVTAFSRAYGDTVEFDAERLGMKWAQFTHLYSPFYMFQYAVGISAAMAVGAQIAAGDLSIRDKYLTFLSLGASKPPIEIFKVVGIDITSPETYRRAFEVVEGYVKTLESLT
jgi:oligoendopeptidase F